MNSVPTEASSLENLNISSSTQGHKNKVKLPRIELSKFNDDIIEWKGFWDQFKSTIHGNNNISAIEKFNYLPTLLKDSALSAISGITLSAKNYGQALEILQARYGNDQVLISAYMQKFVQIPKIQNSNDIKRLRFLCDSVETSVRNLKLLHVETSSSQLVPLLNEKLPNDLREVIARNFENNIWTLDEMLKFLKTEIQAKELSLSVTASNVDKSAKRNHVGENLYAAAALIAHNNFKRNNLKNHVSSKCLKIIEPASRTKILQQKGLCFISFRKEHLASSCKLHCICRKCNGKHHISICTFEPSKSNVNNPPSQEDSVEATANNFYSNKNTVLLQTALVTATNLSGKLYSETLLLFDSGSQRTYVSTELREKLKLPAVRQERILIKTFGQSIFRHEPLLLLLLKLKKEI